ncbi:MAG: hypothetical protein QOF41_154 [Methylobacteriaceae bacterium]|nr:hypothetical protein [Methylobacteriaceae bacterium]
MGRPQKRDVGKVLKLTVPGPLWSYLSLLSKVSLLGATEGEVALAVLKTELFRLEREKYHDSAAALLVPNESQ